MPGFGVEAARYPNARAFVYLHVILHPAVAGPAGFIAADQFRAFSGGFFDFIKRGFQRGPAVKMKSVNRVIFGMSCQFGLLAGGVGRLKPYPYATGLAHLAQHLERIGFFRGHRSRRACPRQVQVPLPVGLGEGHRKNDSVAANYQCVCGWALGTVHEIIRAGKQRPCQQQRYLPETGRLSVHLPILRQYVQKCTLIS